MTSERLRHVGIIMDGNNRWAKQRGLPGVAGHKAGVERIRDVMQACKARGVEVLTLFAFSSENWQRPPKEVEALMSLFHLYLQREARKLADEGVRLRVIGRRDRFSAKVLKAIEAAEASTAGGATTLVIAADYGGRWDIAEAARKVCEQVARGELSPDAVDEQLLDQHTCLADLPPLDLLVRTSGELRISNFLLWQAAYAELYFCDTLWPDFDETAMHQAVESYFQRQRRFGMTAEQIAEAQGA